VNIVKFTVNESAVLSAVKFMTSHSWFT